MTLVRLRPRADVLYISENRTILATAHDGFVHEDLKTGLFVDETRLLSRYRYLANGKPAAPVGSSPVEARSWLGYYVVAPYPSPGHDCPGMPPQHVVELKLSRSVGDGLHEDVDLRNFTQTPVRFTLALEVDADFQDIAEVEAGERQYHPNVSSHWQEAGDGTWELRFQGHAENRFDHQRVERGVAVLERAAIVSIRSPEARPTYDSGRITWVVELAPQQTWHACVVTSARIEGEVLAPAYGCRAFAGMQSDRDVKRETFFHYATRFSAPGSGTLTPVVLSALEQARRDLIALRLYDRDHGERAWTMAAGLPVYLGLFGRDSLTTAWQAALVSADMLRGTLPEIARWQGTEKNDWRDEEAGKMPHQVRRNPLSHLNILPWGRYYASITTSGFYPVAVSEAWHWTGDRALVEPLLDPALRALAWLDQHGGLDGDGFYEYLARSEEPQKNQGWKDSDEAIAHADGRQAEAPIATCEEQGFVYLAKLHLSEVCWWFGRKDEARRLFREASELKERFNDRFWMPDERYFALGLDKDKRLIRSITSNPGHCLATAIVDQALVEPTVERMFSAELFSGWGIRTLSSRHPAYNPHAYQQGSIWPVEQGTFALALMRYGLRKHVQALCRAQFEAAALFDHHRLPECFSGHTRDSDHPFPAIYMQACSPQAWSASAVFSMLQAMLGLYPYAPLHLLLLDPDLPEWLPEITVENLHVGDAVVTLRFLRTDKGKTQFDVLDKRGRLHILQQPSPWSLTATFVERLVDMLKSLTK